MPASIQPQRVVVAWDRSRDPQGLAVYDLADLTTNVGGTLLPLRVWDGPCSHDGARTATDRMRLEAVRLTATTLPASFEVEVWSRYCDTPGRLLASIALPLPGLVSSGLILSVSTAELVPSWEIRARLTAGAGVVVLHAMVDRRGAPEAVHQGALVI